MHPSIRPPSTLTLTNSPPRPHIQILGLHDPARDEEAGGDGGEAEREQLAKQLLRTALARVLAWRRGEPTPPAPRRRPSPPKQPPRPPPPQRPRRGSVGGVRRASSGT